MTAGKRRLAAIVAADVAAYSRLVSEDEEGTLAALRGHRDELIDPLLESHDGRIANTAGDSLLIEFASAVEAVRCAIAVQHGMAARNLAVPRARQISFRIGINVGDVREQDGDLLGEGVNVAARLEGLAEPGGIYLSQTTYDQIRDRLSVAVDDLGEVQVRNIPRPVRVFRLSSGPTAVLPGSSGPGPSTGSSAGPLRQRAPVLVGLLLTAIVGAVAVYAGVTDPPAPAQTPAATTGHLPPPSAQPAPTEPAVSEAPPAAAATTTATAAPQTIESRATPQPAPATDTAAATARFAGIWTGSAFCDVGTGFETNNLSFRVRVGNGRAELDLAGSSLQDGGRSRHAWTVPIDETGQADASTRALTGRTLPILIDLSAAPRAGRIDFDGCAIELSLATAQGQRAAAPTTRAPPPDGRWSAYFDDCGTSFGGVPLVYSVALRVRDGTYNAELDVADTYETVRTTVSGEVDPEGRLEGRFETSLKTSEVQTLRADLSGAEAPPWIAIDDCRRPLKPLG